MNTNRKTGFTLVEIFIVVAIIMLLAAIIMPSLKRARSMSMSMSGGNKTHSAPAAERWTGNTNGW